MVKTKKRPVSVSAVAVDIVIFSMRDSELNVLLLQSRKGPFAGKWVLPGGLVTPEETLEESAERHMFAKAGLKNVYFEQLYTFGTVNRDPRNRVVSVAYIVLVPEEFFNPKTNELYGSVEWRAVSDLPKLGYDHNEIVSAAVDRLRSKLTYTNIVYGLLPEKFTLGELQKTYEVILRRKLDKRNFRKKILQTKLLKKSSKKLVGQAYRPAELYSFAKRTPQFAEVV